MANRKALGRGLKALIPDSDPDPAEVTSAAAGGAVPQGNNVVELAVGDIRPNPYQPRINFEPDALDDLVNSIREKGVISPVVVRAAAGGGYELIAGERRFRAVTDLGYQTIPAIVRQVSSEEEMLELSLIENIQREQLNPIEEARSYKSLVSKYGYTQEKISEKVGKSRATVANALRLLHLPDPVQAMVFDGVLTVGHARPLLALKSGDNQEKVASRTVKQGLSVRAVERLVRDMTGTGQEKQEKDKGAGPRRSKRFFSFEENLKRCFGTKVSIREKGGRGKVEIEFYSDDDLDRILDLLSRCS